jgi:chromosome partitioning protein
MGTARTMISYGCCLNAANNSARWAEDNFDFTIIDYPPSIAIQVRFMLSVADSYIVPAIPDRLSVRGLLYLAERIKSYGYKIHGLGTLWSLYREQNAIHKRIVQVPCPSNEQFAFPGR